MAGLFFNHIDVSFALDFFGVYQAIYYLFHRQLLRFSSQHFNNFLIVIVLHALLVNTSKFGIITAQSLRFWIDEVEAASG